MGGLALIHSQHPAEVFYQLGLELGTLVCVYLLW